MLLFEGPECLFWLLLTAQGLGNLGRRVVKSDADRTEMCFRRNVCRSPRQQRRGARGGTTERGGGGVVEVFREKDRKSRPAGV